MNEQDGHLANLEATLPGQVIMRSDPAFEAAATIWNRTAKRPRAVVRCRHAQDVQAALATARAAGLPLAVRCGGHDWTGRAMSEGLVIDLTAMNEVEIAPDRAHVRVGGGTRGIDVARATDMLGLAAPCGSVGVVGLGGLVLGGGYGPMIARCGMASDNLLGAEVVLADGRIVTAGSGHNEDLLWALKGGGGNFGVVTAMVLRLVPTAGLHCGLVLYPQALAETVILQVDALCRTAPDALTVQLVFISLPDGTPAIGVIPYWSGEPAAGGRQVAPFEALGEPFMADLKQRSFTEALSLFDGPMTEPHHVLMDTCWVPSLSPAVAAVLARQGAARPSPGCALVTHEFRGAAARVPSNASAWGFRQPHVLIEIVVQHDDPDETAGRTWARETLAALAPLSMPGAYANLIERDDPRVRQSFGDNAGRLATLKRRFDPTGLFSSAPGLPG